jgi:hypothetical protein
MSKAEIRFDGHFFAMADGIEAPQRLSLDQPVTGTMHFDPDVMPVTCTVNFGPEDLTEFGKAFLKWLETQP